MAAQHIGSTFATGTLQTLLPALAVGWAPGDVVIAYCLHDGGTNQTSWNVSTGWTEIRASTRTQDRNSVSSLQVLTLEVGSIDPPEFSYGGTGTEEATILLDVWRNVVEPTALHAEQYYQRNTLNPDGLTDVISINKEYVGMTYVGNVTNSGLSDWSGVADANWENTNEVLTLRAKTAGAKRNNILVGATVFDFANWTVDGSTTHFQVFTCLIESIVGPSSLIASRDGVPWADINSLDAVPVADISAVDGVSVT